MVDSYKYHLSHPRASLILFAFYIDNILDDKPEVKNSADKEEQPVDEIPKRIKKSDNTTQSKGKVGRFSNRMPKKSPNYFSIPKKDVIFMKIGTLFYGFLWRAN